MAAASASSNKAKIARRVIEVLDYFDDDHREATVMDIVRRYNRPQSSTSELLSSLVELGLLHKDPYSRSYSLSPRAALLGTAGQSEVIRDGRINRLIDRLVAQTGLSVALFAMVGQNAQIAHWRAGPRASATATDGLYGGMQTPLNQAAAGQLLLSTIEQPRREGMIRRLNAEAADEHKFSFAEMVSRVQDCGDQGHACGPVGFGSRAQVLALLIPGQPSDHPLAVGFVHAADDKVSAENLLHCLTEAVQQCLGQEAREMSGTVQRFPNAA
ncbi:MAG: helix-turn-helix domain-containing protein [Novosphingobium sp.]|nr:helix-turn-helix domain-containing protein [Novosphingobium sp.]